MTTDIIYGTSANETLQGGGADCVGYNTLYVFEVGGGQDTINDYYADWHGSMWYGGVDTLQ